MDRLDPYQWINFSDTRETTVSDWLILCNRHMELIYPGGPAVRRGDKQEYGGFGKAVDKDLSGFTEMPIKRLLWSRQTRRADKPGGIERISIRQPPHAVFPKAFKAGIRARRT
jgi:hypothetical protein